MDYVSGLHCYPIKSCAVTNLETATFTEHGIAFDREWMVADGNGKFMSQRQNPELALVIPKLSDGFLRITAPGMEELAVDLEDLDQEKVVATVHSNDAPAIAQGAEASGWFSEYLKTEGVQFLRRDPSNSRLVKPVFRSDGVTNKLGFADGGTILLTSVPSLSSLNERLNPPVPMNRFRTNVEVDGDDLEAFDEDFWRQFNLGNLPSVVAWACSRCKTTETDQSTGTQEKRVLKALQGFRRGVNSVDPTDKGVFFGENVSYNLVDGETVAVSVGDGIEVIERSTERNVLGLAA